MSNSTQTLPKELSKWWWLPLLQGLAAFLLAAALWSAPLKTLIGITYWLGLYWMFDGVINIVRAFTGGTGQSRMWLLLAGIVGLIAGAMMTMHPTMAGVVSLNFMVALFAVSMLINGLILVLFGRHVEGEGRRRSWGSFLIGLLYVLGGCLLFMNPSMTAVTLWYMFIFWAIFVGFGSIFLSFELKALGKKSD